MILDFPKITEAALKVIQVIEKQNLPSHAQIEAVIDLVREEFQQRHYGQRDDELTQIAKGFARDRREIS